MGTLATARLLWHCRDHTATLGIGGHQGEGGVRIPRVRCCLWRVGGGRRGWERGQRGPCTIERERGQSLVILKGREGNPL